MLSKHFNWLYCYCCYCTTIIFSLLYSQEKYWTKAFFYGESQFINMKEITLFTNNDPFVFMGSQYTEIKSYFISPLRVERTCMYSQFLSLYHCTLIPFMSNSCLPSYFLRLSSCLRSSILFPLFF